LATSWRSRIHGDDPVPDSPVESVATVDRRTRDGRSTSAILVAIVLVVAIGVAGAVLYARSGPHGPAPAAVAAAASAQSVSSSELPTIAPAPGERFPIERGFVYLVKEKRPGIAFAMFRRR